MYRVFFIFLFLLSVSIQSQNTEVEFTKSEIFSEEKSKTSLLFAKEDGNGDIFIVKNFFSQIASPKGYYIEHYDKELKLLKKTEIEVERSEIKGLYLAKNQIVLLVFKYLQKEKKYVFVTLTSDMDEFNFTEKEVISIDRKEIKKYDHYGIRSEPEFNIHRSNNLGDIVESNNGEFIAINVFKKSEDGDRMLVTVFTRGFEKVYEQELDDVVDYEKKGDDSKLPLAYQNMVVGDSDGTVFIIAKVYKSTSTKMKKAGGLSYNFILFRLDKSSKSQEIFSEYENEYVRSLKLVANKTDMACLGFYTEDLRNNEENGPSLGNLDFGLFNGMRYDGIVRFNIDMKTGKVIKYEANPFSERFMIDKYGKEKDHSHSHLIFRDVLMLANGDAILNVEEFDIFVSGNTIQSRNTYADIISCRISKDGELIWSRNINKIQKAWSLNNIEALSYASIARNNMLYMFLNANEENTSSRDYRTTFRTDNKEHFLHLVSIEENGEMEFTKLPKEKTNGASLGVRFAIQINESDLLLEGEVDDKPQLFRLSIK